MKRFLPVILAAVPLLGTAQALPEGNEHLDPSAGYAGRAVFRTEFISYDSRQTAETRDPSRNKFYLPLEFERTAGRDGDLFRTVADIPYIWLDRDVYLQVTGLDSYYIYIGDEMVAYGEDSRNPMQFLISPHITDGENTIAILHAGGIAGRIEGNTAPTGEQVPEVFIFSQPKLCIADYRLRFWPDSTNSYGIINARIIVSNSYNSTEKVTIGYDLYSPQGKLQHYDMRQIELEGRSHDTLYFREFIYKTNPNTWSPQNPALYFGMLTVRRDNRMVEYIPFRIGFGKTELADGSILRNGKPVDIKAIGYNGIEKEAARKALAGFKKEGYNTILPDYPQPAWFYDLCDENGFYVFDNANINPPATDLGPIPGGQLANDPQWLGRFLKRTESMRARNVNRTCVVAWSMGNDSGNGYNLYETYLDLKSRELFRPVTYNFAAGQWDTDLPPVNVQTRQ